MCKLSSFDKEDRPLHDPNVVQCNANRLRLWAPAARWLANIGKGPAAAATTVRTLLVFGLSALVIVTLLPGNLKNVYQYQWSVRAMYHAGTAIMSMNALGTETIVVTGNNPGKGTVVVVETESPNVTLALQQNNQKSRDTVSVSQTHQPNIDHSRRFEFPINCSTNRKLRNITEWTCPKSYFPNIFESKNEEIFGGSKEAGTCPGYFQWIHEDLKPWKESGITRDLVERSRPTAHFRLVIVNGRAYVKKYRKSIQSRDMFTLWGILQLLRRYPGQIPDIELMFDCDDRPVVEWKNHRGPNSTVPPPLFRYCGDKWTADIVFPDWSFWGWAEINIRPWKNLLNELKEGNGRIKWTDREPYAYWKGNPSVAETRQDLLKCNLSDSNDWNARLFIQDWISESQHGFQQSGLADQCKHRYKIYIEGYAWSVSEKYILACDSVPLIIEPHYYDFFTRSLEPLRHYWPVKEHDKCRSIKFAVEWGNTHKRKAESIGKASAAFVQDQVKMDYVYDYMFHLLNEYSKLMKYVPEVPQGALEICSEAMGCSASDGFQREFMMESLVKSPYDGDPCGLPPPFEPKEYASMRRKSFRAIRKVERLENAYWDGIFKQDQKNHR